MVVNFYVQFFGFSERPFTLLPDPSFVFWSDQHERAYTVLEYGIASRAPLTVITGEIGAGKTTLVQKMLESIEDCVTVGLISNAQGGRGDLLRWVLYALSIPASAEKDYITLFETFQDFVISEYAAGRHVLLIIDEAQNLSVEALEELRMFTNINSNKDELLQIILVGQPELRELITNPSLVQFAQRVGVTYHLNPLNEKATRAYIQHRLRCVGGSGNEFSVYAARAIYEESRGVPRIINKLCDMALVYAAVANENTVGVKVIRQLAEDGLFIHHKPREVYILQEPIMQPSRKAAE